MRLVVWPYKITSVAAKLLAKELGVLRVRSNGAFIPRAGDIILNYGNASAAPWFKYLDDSILMLNPPDRVRDACNKLRTFNLLSSQGIPVPQFTTDVNVAKQFLSGKARDDNGFPRLQKCFCRARIAGSGGDGIIIASSPLAIVTAPLYTDGLHITNEYRVHVLGNEPLEVVAKRRRNGARKSLIKSWGNGYVFCRRNVPHHRNVINAAVAAVNILGLTFGAVDVAYNKDTNSVAVLEVNTAPGIEGTTVGQYAIGLTNYINSI